MKRTIAVLVLLAGAASAASALNRIVEWGLHDPNDYIIDSSPGYGDTGVRIFANTDPNHPLMFEAYNEENPFLPGDIDYINIDSTLPVGGLHVSVIPDPGTGRPRGARHLKSLDLYTNGDGTNVLDQIDVMWDVGEIGPLWADWAGTLTIGRDALDVIYITQSVSGPITIGGTLAVYFYASTLDGPLSIGTLENWFEADTLNGPVAIGTLTGAFYVGQINSPVTIGTQTGQDETEKGSGVFSCNRGLRPAHVRRACAGIHGAATVA